MNTRSSQQKQPAAAAGRRSARTTPNPQSEEPPAPTPAVTPRTVPIRSRQTGQAVPEPAPESTEASIEDDFPQSISRAYPSGDYGTVSALNPKKATSKAKFHLKKALIEGIKEWRSEISKSKNISEETFIENLIEDYVEQSFEDSVESAFRALDTLPAKQRSELADKKAISFSKLKKADLERLGVECVPDVDAQKFFDAFVVPFYKGDSVAEQIGRTVDDFWEVANGGTFSWVHHLQVVCEQVSFATEARSRMIIDKFVSAMMTIFKVVKSIILNMPELTLGRSRSPKSKAPMIIHKKMATILSGSVDYACFLLVDSSEQPDEEINDTELVEETELFEENDISKLLEADKFKLAILDIIKKGYGVMFLEAKKYAGSSEEVDTKLLEGYMPQAIGEAIAGTLNLAVKKKKLTGMPWCISDGINWRFGILCSQEPDTNSDYIWKCFSTTEFTYSTKNAGDVVKILKTLIYWLTCPHWSIVNDFNTARSNQ